MKKTVRYERALRAVQRYLVFFALVAFLITCCMTLFITVLTATLKIELTESDLGTAAKLTFINVALLSLIFTVIDAVRRKLTLEREAKQIAEAAERIVKGDLSVRIPYSSSWGRDEVFDEIRESFNKMAEELSGVETLRTDFIANVSHEMKTPLSVIRNYGTLLQIPDLSEEKRHEYAKAITDATRRLSDMMTNILKLNRLENQQIYLGDEKYDLSEQLCEAVLAYESVWEEKEIEIQTEIDYGVIINADSELLSLVWNNLLSNAFKFTDRGGKVKVSLKATESYAVVKVQDTGCGMPSQVGAHIFEKFYQGDSSHATEGNGLGLALVKRVVDIMRGEISVESVCGEGSTFTVRIGRGDL